MQQYASRTFINDLLSPDKIGHCFSMLQLLCAHKGAWCPKPASGQTSEAASWKAKPTRPSDLRFLSCVTSLIRGLTKQIRLEMLRVQMECWSSDESQKRYLTPSVRGWELCFALLRLVQRHTALEKVWGVIVEDLVARLTNCPSS